MYHYCNALNGGLRGHVHLVPVNVILLGEIAGANIIKLRVLRGDHPRDRRVNTEAGILIRRDVKT